VLRVCALAFYEVALYQVDWRLALVTLYVAAAPMERHSAFRLTYQGHVLRAAAYGLSRPDGASAMRNQQVVHGVMQIVNQRFQLTVQHSELC
jgi:hypothetical protein